LLKDIFSTSGLSFGTEGQNDFCRRLFGELIIRLKPKLSKKFPKNMQTKKKRIEITSETRTLLILENSNSIARQGLCEQCEREVLWIAEAEISLFGISELPPGAVHINGDFICSRSLVEAITKGEKR
jgi:hypothetical protein